MSKTIKTVYDADTSAGSDLAETFYFPAENSSGDPVGVSDTQLTALIFDRQSKVVTIPFTDVETYPVSGDGIWYLTWPLSGNWTATDIFFVASAEAPVGAGTSFDIYNLSDSVDIFSTAATVDSTHYSSETAGTPSVIANATISYGDRLRIDINGVGATSAGLGWAVNFYIEGA